MGSSTRQGNTLDAAEINAALQGTALGGRVRHLREVFSTNDLALEAAQAGERSGVWVADAQTAGRGRGGHQWHSAPGDGLYVSVLLTPEMTSEPSFPAQLSLAAGVAAWEAIREVTGISVDIRWPNDLLTRPEPTERSRKLGGILVEAAFQSRAGLPGSASPLRYAVIGIGINVAHTGFPPELAALASSLYLEGWQVPDRQPLLIALLSRLQARLQPEGAERSDPLERLLEASTWVQGKHVFVPEEGGYTGVTAGLDANGYLVVFADDGTRRTVRSGGVREA